MTVIRKKKEYGGFLPLELNPGKEFFTKYEPYVRRYNTVKAAIYDLVVYLRKKRIYIPYYYCPSTSKAIKDIGIEVYFYHINCNLEIECIPDREDSVVVLVDYFGVKNEYVSKKATDYKKADIIIDRAHDFFSEPTLGNNIHNVYSAKKFFGIPDGAYLISRARGLGKDELACSYDYAGYLLMSYECGTNLAYDQKKDTDFLLSNNYDSMSKLSLGLLKNVDYLRVKEQRLNNYKVLHKEFYDNELNIPDECTAYQFPLLITKKGIEIKDFLIKNGVFVSTLWAGDDLKENGNYSEINMMNNAVFLPVDQRYDEEDMEYLICLVRAFLNNT